MTDPEGTAIPDWLRGAELPDGMLDALRYGTPLTIDMRDALFRRAHDAIVAPRQPFVPPRANRPPGQDKLSKRLRAGKRLWRP